MRLAVDASTLVAEVLRARGRRLLLHPRLELYVAADTWGEAGHELRKRVALLAHHRRLEPAAAAQLLDEALAAVTARATIVPTAAYATYLEAARRRVPRDPRDAPTVALALAMGCGIWTSDYDFFGCGLPVWVTETLLAHLSAEDQTE
jgi:predicted nucleic acid-binding protein